MTTKIEQDNPLNLWLANTLVETLSATISGIEVILSADTDDRSKVAAIRAAVEVVQARRERAALETTYEAAVDELTR